MKKQLFLLCLLAVFSIGLSGCAAIAGIFKAGMVWGIILVFLVIFGLIYLFSRGGKK